MGGSTKVRAATVVAALAALALLPVVRSAAAGAVAVAETCTVDGPVTQSGSTLISVPMAEQIAGSPLAITVPTEATVTDQINPGGTVASTATLHLDLAGIADDVLEERVKPAVAATGYPALAATAWVELTLDPSTVTFALPPGTTPTGTPVASSPDTSAAAAFTPEGVTLTLGSLSADTRSPGPPQEASVDWHAVDGGAPAPRTLTLLPPTVTFTASVTVGVLFFGAPLTGGVQAAWACTPDEPDTVLGTTDVVSTPVGTITPTTPPPSTGPTSSTSSTSTTTTTPWPSDTTIAAGSCAVSGFDRYGGFTGRDVGATGAFRTSRIDGRWWLVDPDGHPFFSAGVNHITATGTPDKFGYSLYSETVAAKYADHQAWADAQVARMQAWGFNTAGAWSDLDVLAPQVPYVVLIGMTGQDFGTGHMEDLFDPTWETNVRAAAQSAAAQHASNPNLIGYWTDNELHFGPDWRPLHLFDDYLARPATAPGKQALLTFLQGRYPTFADFAADFTTGVSDWTTLADPTTVTAWTTPGGRDTRTAWMAEVTERYFSVTDAALTEADPVHLNLGPRMIAQTAGVPLLEAAARHVDVASLNLYPILPELVAPLLGADPTYLPVDGGAAAQAAALGSTPILISEWSYRAADSGLPNTWPPLFPTLDTQDQRAAAYESYVQTLLDTTWIVGQHWFEHADEPFAGRFDGEDSNFGLVDNYDEPYHPLVDVSKTMHDCAYARLLSTQQAAPTSTTTSTTPPPATSTTTPPVTAATAGPASAVDGDPDYTG